MESPGHIRALSALALVLVCAIFALAQWDKKPYTEWSEKETQKMLNDSPWSKTQTFIASTETFGTTRPDGGQGRFVNTFPVNFRIRFFSAKPVRQALSRAMEEKMKGNINEQLTAQLKSFATGVFNEYIVITVSCDSEHRGGPLHDATALLQKRTTAELKSNTFLEVKGQKVYLQEYQSPRNDGFGARFIFPRVVNGEPFITPATEEVRFYSELSGPESARSGPSGPTSTSMTYTLNMRYKVSAMNFQGKLEY